MNSRICKVWNDSNIDRAYILGLLGYAPQDCDAYSHSLWRDLPIEVRIDLETMRGVAQ